MDMFLTINGQVQDVESVRTVAELLSRLSLSPQQVVVELNEKVIRRNQVNGTPLEENDRLEILRFVGGG
jgi:thiamine biosynthesis protein ThiS